MNILVTRPQNSAVKTAEKLEAMDHKALITPLFKLEKISSPPPSPKTQALIITSQNGARALCETDWFDDVKQIDFYIVGNKSATFLQQRGVNNIKHVAPQSAQLIDALNQLCEHYFTYCTGFHYALNMDSLSPHHHLDVLPLYKATPDQDQIEAARALLHQKAIDAIFIYSARTARLVCELILTASHENLEIINHINRLKLYCLSHNIAYIVGDILGQHTPRLIWPDIPDEQALLNMLPRNI